jgi:hypothetical protein
MKDKSRQESVVRESVATTRLYHSNPRRKTTLGVDNLGLGRLLLLDFWKVRLAQGEEEMRV